MIMIPDSLGQTLHDRATRGQPLSPTEQTQLNAWYDHQDAIEAAALNLTPTYPDIDLLQQRINQAYEQLQSLSQQMQTLAAENAAIRQENRALRQQLTQLLTTSSV